ncbi:putative glucan endo-1 [Ranunculus cassubicifolius]
MRIYDPNSEVLQALRGSNIELMLGVPNEDLESLADKSVATKWVERNVLQYIPDVKITYVAVGNEVNRKPEYSKHVVSAMKNIFSSIEDLRVGSTTLRTACAFPRLPIVSPLATSYSTRTSISFLPTLFRLRLGVL